jgi:ABC-type Fe3+-hydroxamate transport system substrate-binding protein
MKAASATTQAVTDQMGRHITIPQRPHRIISLVPSQTELLFDLGLGEVVVGVTKFCVHPSTLLRASPADPTRDKPVIGGTKQFNFDLIDQLQPDLILGNKEENYQEGIERLAATYPVWMSDIYTLADALKMIRQVGGVTGKEAGAEQMAQEIEARFAALPALSRPLRVGYFIWQKPFMVAGRPTFVDAMLARCGFVNALAGVGDGRYPEVTFEIIQAADLDAILLSSEPFPFGEKQRAEFVAQFPGTAVYLVDGEMFSWYGSRLLLAAGYFRQFITAVAEEFGLT